VSDYNDYPPPSGEPVVPPPGAGWDSGGPASSQRQEPGTEVLSNGGEHEINRRRVAVTIAAIVATLGAVIGGVVLASGSNSKPTHATAGANPNAVVDPPSASATRLPTLSGVPVAPPTLGSASAMASAQAAQKAFAPPTAIPSDVVPYAGSAPLDAVSLPPFLTVSMPGIQAKDTNSQVLATQFESFLKAWVEAWATGSTADARYRAWCVDQCRTVLDPTVALWKNANILPAGTLRFFQMAGGTANGGLSGEAGVCLDDSQLTAFRNGVTYVNPYPMGAPTLYVFGLVWDKAVGHWVVSESYASPGDSYCAPTGSAS
jgi:hypothetical protein